MYHVLLRIIPSLLPYSVGISSDAVSKATHAKVLQLMQDFKVVTDCPSVYRGMLECTKL